MCAIGIVVLGAVLLGTALPSEVMRYPVAAVLIGLGIYRFVRHRHPRWVRMQVGFRDLIVWSFLMASAHGAGLMVLPVLLGSGPSLEAANDTRATLTYRLVYARLLDCWPPAFTPSVISRSQGLWPGLSIGNLASLFYAAPGSISTWSGPLPL
jgi:hypothetical protein